MTPWHHSSLPVRAVDIPPRSDSFHSCRWDKPQPWATTLPFPALSPMMRVPGIGVTITAVKVTANYQNKEAASCHAASHLTARRLADNRHYKHRRELWAQCPQAAFPKVACQLHMRKGNDNNGIGGENVGPDHLRNHLLRFRKHCLQISQSLHHGQLRTALHLHIP